jgi:hypothetical protein
MYKQHFILFALQLNHYQNMMITFSVTIILNIRYLASSKVYVFFLFLMEKIYCVDINVQQFLGTPVIISITSKDFTGR